MRGWKTWTAGILSIVYGALGWLVDLHGADTAMQFCINGLAIIGVGHKIEKSSTEIVVTESDGKMAAPLDELVKRNQQ